MELALFKSEGLKIVGFKNLSNLNLFLKENLKNTIFPPFAPKRWRNYPSYVTNPSALRNAAMQSFFQIFPPQTRAMGRFLEIVW